MSTVNPAIVKYKDSEGNWVAVSSFIGPKGDTGDTGPSNTLTIGTVENSSTASATITGTSPNQVLNLVLPIFTGGTIPHGWFETAITLSSGAIDLSLGNCFLLTITANTTLTFTNAQNCSVFTLVLTNGGSKTITYPSNVKWNDNLPPTLIASGVDVLTFITPDGGTTWYGLQAVMGVSV